MGTASSRLQFHLRVNIHGVISLMVVHSQSADREKRMGEERKTERLNGTEELCFLEERDALFTFPSITFKSC